MTKDDVLRWARESGMSIHGNMETDAAMAFAALAYAAGQKAEREACVKVCEESANSLTGEEGMRTKLGWQCAAAIRARGNGGQQDGR